MWLKRLIAEFIKKNGRKPNAIETIQLKFKANDLSNRGQVINFPDSLREFTRKEDLYEGLPTVLRNAKNPEEVKRLLDSGDIQIGKAPKTTKNKPPVDPKFKRAVDSQEERARLIREFEKRNKESAFNFAFKKYKEIDRKPMEIDEVLSIYTNLNKYPKGRSIIFGDIAEIERGHMLPNIGNRNREMIINKLNKMVVAKEQPNPFKKAPGLKEGEQIEMDFTDWDPKGMAGGGLAYMLGEGGSAEDATNFLNRIAPQGERLAYINPKEEKMLRDAGGSGIMTKQGIPSFTEDEEDTGDVSNPGGGMSSSPDTSPDSGDDDKALSYVNWNQPTRGPDPTRDEGGGDNQPWYQNPYVKAASFMLNPAGTIISGGVKSLYDDYMRDKAIGTNITNAALSGSQYFGPTTNKMQRDYRKTTGLKSPDDPPRDDGGNEFVPPWLRQQQPSTLGIEAIAPKDDFDLYAVVEGREPSRFYANGGRIGFNKGGFSKGRRNFLKFMAGVASLPIVGKFFKGAKPAAKVAEAVKTSDAVGMPSWFPKLVDRVVKEGTDVTKQFGTIEREIVHVTELPDSKTKVMVTQDLNTGNVAVDIGSGKHGFGDGRHGQPVRLELNKGEWTTNKEGKGVKTKDEFFVEEAEFTGGHPENIKYEDSVIESYGNHASDFSEVEKYATGKVEDTFNVKGTKKADSDAWNEGRMEAEAEAINEMDDIPDMAKGGLAHMLGE